MPTLFDFQARKIERMAASLADFVSSTAPDRLNWCPSTGPDSSTRSVLEMIDECIAVNRYSAALLRGETPDKPATDAPVVADGDVARRELMDSGRELADAVRKLDDNALTSVYPHWRGPIVGEVLIEAPYRNMAYHAGQVNFIQLLAGDSEFHMPPTWLGAD